MRNGLQMGTTRTSNAREADSVCIGIDSYNLCLTGDIGRTLTGARGGYNEHVPCILIKEKHDLSESDGTADGE